MNSSMLVFSAILMFLMATAVSSRSVQQAKTYYTDDLSSDLTEKQADEATGNESETAILEEVLRRLMDEQSSSASAEDAEKFREVRERKVVIFKSILDNICINFYLSQALTSTERCYRVSFARVHSITHCQSMLISLTSI